MRHDNLRPPVITDRFGRSASEVKRLGSSFSLVAMETLEMRFLKVGLAALGALTVASTGIAADRDLSGKYAMGEWHLRKPKGRVG